MKVVVPEAAYKIGQVVAGERAEIAEEKAAIVVEVKIEVVLDPTKITAQFQLMLPMSPRQRILILKGGVMELGWALWRRTEAK